MNKKFLNTLSLNDIIVKLHNGEKVFNELDDSAYVKYATGIGLCKFHKGTNELMAMNIPLTTFYHLYFEEEKDEDYSKMIGYAGWFWDNFDSCKVIGILTEYRGKETINTFCRNGTSYFTNFQPAKKSELKFWEEEDE